MLESQIVPGVSGGFRRQSGGFLSRSEFLNYAILSGLKRSQLYSITRALVFGVALMSCAMVVARNAGAQDDGYYIDGPEELIFSVMVPPYVLSSGIIAYQNDVRFYLPVVTLANLFDFGVESDLGRGVVSGWALEEGRTFSIDVERKTFEVAGKRETLGDLDVLSGDAVDSTDMYVEIGVLNKIWPVELGINISMLAVEVSSDQKLPFMQKMERQDKREMQLEMRKTRLAAKRSDLPFVPTPYRAFSLPFVDLDTEWGYDSDEDDTTGTLRLTGVNDLGYFQADYTTTLGYKNGELEEPDNIRLRFSREAQGEDSLFAGIRHVEWGDTRARHSTLIENGTSGRGVYVTSTDRARDGEYDITTVEGIGTPGWEVELYRNGELLDFQIVDARGEYRFEDVPLNFGNNRIRLVFYGPQGQIRERIENYSFGSGMVEPGQFQYSLSAVDANEDLIRLSDDNVDNPEGVAYSGRASYGLTRGLTVFATTSQTPTRDDDTHNYVTGGAALSTALGLFQAEGYKQLDGGQAIDLRYNTEWKGVNVALRTALYNDFESADAGFGDGALKRDHEGDLSRNFKLPFGLLTLGLNAREEENKIGDTRTSYRTRQSLSFAGVRLGNTTTTSLTDGSHSTSTGQVSVNVRQQRWLLRSQLDYDIFPERDITNVQNELRYSEPEGFFAALNLNHNFVESQSSVGVQLGYDFEKFLGSVESRWQQDEGFSVLMRASTALAPLGPNGNYTMTSDRQSAVAPVRGRVFLDQDGDGLFDEGEQPLQHAQIMVGSYNGANETDEYGQTINYGTAYRLSNVMLDDGSLEDPYYRSGSEGFSVFLRPGVVPSFDFPVVVTGAIDGMVARPDGTPVQGMRLELVNKDGGVVMTTDSAYDGYYTFEFVAPGTYTVRADPAYGVDVPPQTVTVEGDDLFPGGIDLQLITPAAGGAD
ncbi:carboxypeptidase regulatory-like domain-containing protein [Micavibrio aeruginosavorus]|nr:carboxypeptidase regulatory-like domain-containing protein [Micavibrio aeruginosavorus]